MGCGRPQYHLLWNTYHRSTGCPKKITFKLIFEFLILGEVFLGVENNSKNFGNKKILGCLAKFWVNGHCLSEKCRNFGVFMSFWPCQEWKTFSKCHKSQYFCICTYKYQIFWLFKWFLHFLNWQTYKNSRKMEDFEQNKVHLLKILLNNLIFFCSQSS